MTPKRLARARQVHELHVQGLTYREIGARFGISASQARVDDVACQDIDGQPFCVEWDYNGEHYFNVYRAWNAHAAIRKYGYSLAKKTARPVSEEEFAMLQDLYYQQIGEEYRWETDDRVAFAEHYVASQGSA